MKSLIWFDGNQFIAGLESEYVIAQTIGFARLISFYQFDCMDDALRVTAGFNRSNLLVVAKRMYGDSRNSDDQSMKTSGISV